MFDRNSISLYALALGTAVAFYAGPYRTAAQHIANAMNSAENDKAVIGEERLVLRRAASLRELQRRVQRAIRSPFQVDLSASDGASFLDRLRLFSKREHLTLTSIVQGSRAQPARRDGLLSGSPIRLAAIGEFARVLTFLGSLESSVGLLDIESVEIDPIPSPESASKKLRVRIQIDGTAYRLSHFVRKVRS